MSKGDEATGFLEGILVGSAVGAFIGFLLAPASGEGTRSKLQQKLEEVRETCVNLKQDFQNKPEELVEKTVHAIEQGLTELTKMIEAVKQAAAERRQDVERDPSYH